VRGAGSDLPDGSLAVAYTATPAPTRMIPRTNVVQMMGFVSSYVSGGIQGLRCSICGLFGFGVVQPKAKMPVVAVATAPVPASPKPTVFPTDAHPDELASAAIMSTAHIDRIRDMAKRQAVVSLQCFIVLPPLLEWPPSKPLDRYDAYLNESGWHLSRAPLSVITLTSTKGVGTFGARSLAIDPGRRTLRRGASNDPRL
jgi:hypothetical protein